MGKSHRHGRRIARACRTSPFCQEFTNTSVFYKARHPWGNPTVTADVLQGPAGHHRFAINSPTLSCSIKLATHGEIPPSRPAYCKGLPDITVLPLIHQHYRVL